MLLARYEAEARTKGLSSASISAASATINHIRAAMAPTQASVQASIVKAARHCTPVVPRYDVVPDIHDFFRITATLADSTEEKKQRAHLLLTLSLLTGRRCSDLAHITRHESSLKFEVRTVDAPDWAIGTSLAASILHDLGLIPQCTMTHNQFICMSFRSANAKTTSTRNIAYTPWVPLHECRFQPATCPVLACARYLSTTSNVKKPTVFTPRLPPENRQAKTTPLILSLNGRPRTPLKGNTIGGVLSRQLGLKDHKSAPHVLRATSTSYKQAYGVPLSRLRIVSDWKDTDTIFKHYLRLASVPVNPEKLKDAQLHDWYLQRAHQIFTLQNNSPTQ
jgi:hypothetical protein